MKSYLSILFLFLNLSIFAQDLKVYYMYQTGLQLKSGDNYSLEISVKKTDTTAPAANFQLFYFWQNEPSKKFGAKAKVGKWTQYVEYSVPVPNTINTSNTITVYITSDNDTFPDNDTVKIPFYIADAYKNDLKVELLSESVRDFLPAGGTKEIKILLTNIGTDTLMEGDLLRFKLRLNNKSIFVDESPIITYSGDPLLRNESTVIKQYIDIPNDARVSRQNLCYEMYWIEFNERFGAYVVVESSEKDNIQCFPTYVVATDVNDHTNFEFGIQQSGEYLQVTGYPNNADQIFLSASLHDLSGREVSASHAKSNHYQLPIGNQSGIMILRLKTTEGFINHKVFIH